MTTVMIMIMIIVILKNIFIFTSQFVLSQYIVPVQYSYLITCATFAGDVTYDLNLLNDLK